MRIKRWALGGLGASVVGFAAAATAWACIAGPLVNLNTQTVKPGDEVTVNAKSLTGTDKVVLRWNALDGPVLGELMPGPDPRFGRPGGLTDVKLRIPADARPGSYVLILTQVGADGRLSQIPARTLVTVTAPDGTTPVLGARVGTPAPERPQGLVRGEGVSTGAKVLVALGVGGVALFIAGMAALFAGRRPAPQAVRVRT